MRTQVSSFFQRFSVIKFIVNYGKCLFLSGLIFQSLVAFEIKFDLDAYLDMGIMIARGEPTQTEGNGGSASATPANPEITDIVLPTDFSYKTALNFFLTEKHMLFLSWEIAFMNQGYLQIDSPESWQKTLTENSLGERELQNEVILEYIAQPLPILWLMPYAAYQTQSETHGDNFNFKDSFFSYHGYRVGLELGYHEEGDYFVRFRDEEALGWTSSVSVSYGDTFFDSNDFTISGLTLPVNSPLGNSNTQSITLSSGQVNAENFLNYRDVKTAFKTVFKQENMFLEFGYSYEVNFIKNQLFLDEQFSLSNANTKLLKTGTNQSSLQSASIVYQIFLKEREAKIRGASGDYWSELKFGYFFEADFYNPQALKLGYKNAPSLIESVNLLGQFSTSSHDMALYLEHEDEKFLHLLTLEPRLNFLPNRALGIYYGWTVVDFKNYTPSEKTQSTLATSQRTRRLDQFHSIRMTFDFFDFLGVRLIEPYIGFTAILSNDALASVYQELYTVGFNFTYHF